MMPLTIVLHASSFRKNISRTPSFHSVLPLGIPLPNSAKRDCASAPVLVIFLLIENLQVAHACKDLALAAHFLQKRHVLHDARHLVEVPVKAAFVYPSFLKAVQASH